MVEKPNHSKQFASSSEKAQKSFVPNVGIGTLSPVARLDVFATGAQSAIVVPRETTALRPTGVNGMIRYNTTTQKFEVYEGVWQNMITAQATGDNLGNHIATQAILATAGAVGGPSIAFSGDTDTGIWSPGAGILAASTNGTERMRIAADGSVGIGTNAPAYPLSVVGKIGLYDGPTLRGLVGAPSWDTSYISLQNGTLAESSANSAINQNSLGDTMVNAASGRSLYFRIANNAGNGQLQMSSGTLAYTGGSVGIGTTSGTTGSILDVQGTGVQFSSMIVPRDTTAARPTTGVNGMIRYNTTTQKFEVYEGVWQNMITAQASGADNLGNHTATVPIIGVTGSAGGPSYTFSGDTSTGLFRAAAGEIGFSTIGTERLRVDGSGNLGIGTSTMSADLHIQKKYYQPGLRVDHAGTTGGGDPAISVVQTAASNGVASMFISRGQSGYMGVTGYGTTGVVPGASQPEWYAGLMTNPGVGAAYNYGIYEATGGNSLGTDGNGGTGALRFAIEPGGNIYIGNGKQSATAAGSIFGATGGFGTDNQGADLTLAGGRSTGNLAGGAIRFQTSDAGVSATTLRNLSDKMILTGAGKLGIGTTSPTAGTLLDVFGTGTGDSSVLIPRGSTSNRPTGVNGMIRYNTTTQKFEVYEGVWQNMITAQASGADNLGNHTATQSILAVAGTSSAPSYTFVGDTDTGMWSPTANKISFAAGGVDTLRIESGLVGIGEMAPNAKLDIKMDNGTGSSGFNAGGAASLKISRGAGNFTGLMLGYWVSGGVDVGGAIIPASGTNDIIFGSDNTTETMRITGAGRLAIGTSTATTGSILDLRGTGTSLSSLLIPRDTTANRPTGVNGMIRYNTTTQKFEVYEGVWQNMITAQASGADNLGNHTATVPLIGVVGTAGGPGYTFSGDTDTGLWSPGANTIAASTSGTERLRIDSNGNVGIGTTSAFTRLDIFSQNYAIDSGFATSSLMTNTAQTAGAGGSLGLGGQDGVSDRYFAVISGRKENSTSGNYAGYLELATRSNGSQPAERMRITSTGSVGIGTTSPLTGAILDVSGTSSSFSSLIVPRSTTALRPTTGINGMIRYNTTSQKFEVYEGVWQNMLSSGVASSVNFPLLANPIGTAGGPAYSFNGDTDTGLWSAGNNILAASTGGTERMRLAANGNVGVGTTSPTSILDVVSSGQPTLTIRSTATNSNTGINIVGRSGGVDHTASLWAGNGGELNFRPAPGTYTILQDGAGNERIGINSTGDVGANGLNALASGSVGIGTTTPATGAALDIVGSGAPFSSIIVPRDTTALRPTTGINGMIRYNTTSLKFEVYEGRWQNMLSSSGGADNLGNHTATVPIIGVAGTAGGPGYTFSGDTDTGLWSPGAGILAASTNGTERLRIAANGNVGVGTPSPQMNIDIAPPSNALAQLGLRSTSGNGGRIYFGTGGSYTGAGANAAGVIAYHASVSGGFEFRTNNSTANDPDAVQYTKFVIAGDGKLGAGTTSPTAGAIFDLNGTGAAFSSILLPRDTTANRPATGVNGMIRYNTTSLKFEVYEGRWQNMLSTASGGSTTFPLLANPTGTAGGPAYSFNGDTDTGLWSAGNNILTASTGGTERMRIAANGNLGIGTINPPVSLTVSGGLRIDNDNASNSSGGWQTALTFGSSSGEGISSKRTAGGNQYGLDFFTNSTNRLSIDVNGNVGIGTSSPATTLDVAGSASFSSTFEGVSSYANSGTGYTIPDASVNIRRITLDNPNPTITLPAFTTPTSKVYQLTVFIKQDATGNRLATWAGSGSDTIKWDSNTQPTLASGANKITILQFLKPSDETVWYGSLVWQEQ